MQFLQLGNFENWTGGLDRTGKNDVLKGMVKMMKAHDERMKQVYTVGELGEIKWIGWMNREDADGDCLFTPQTTYIRIEDNQGQFFKVYSSGQSMFECEITERSMWIGLFLNR